MALQTWTSLDGPSHVSAKGRYCGAWVQRVLTHRRLHASEVYQFHWPVYTGILGAVATRPRRSRSRLQRYGLDGRWSDRMDSTGRPLRVIIAGGGPGGLALARGLVDLPGLEIRILEGRPEELSRLEDHIPLALAEGPERLLSSWVVKKYGTN
eukprot:symbB.v1.2.017817.t3/scaffold1395.1/size121899/9